MRIYTRKSVDERFWPKVDKDGPIPSHVPELGQCWVWTACKNKFGYGILEMSVQNEWKPKPAHVVAWFLDSGLMPSQCVLHRCDNPSCVRIDHLFLGTKQENNIDRDQKGRNKLVQPTPEQRARGERNGNSKLNEQMVIEIRSAYASGNISQQKLADKYGINQSKISSVIRRETWTHVSDEMVVG